LKVETAGENSLIIYFSGDDSLTVLSQVQHMTLLLEQSMSDAIQDMIPSYASLLIIFDSKKTNHFTLRRMIDETYRSTIDDCSPPLKAADEAENLIEVPVYYSEESGPDLIDLATKANLTLEQVVEIHQAQEYRVYAIGFAPGFAYLGEVDPRIATKRLHTPRLKVPKGAVAIADQQTAVYPSVSPGGWNIIGLSPMELFKPETKSPVPFKVGGRVRFRSIDRDEFFEQGGTLDGLYELKL